MSFRVTLPANATASVKTYLLTLRATGRGSASASVKVRVGAAHPVESALHAVQAAAGFYGSCAVLSDGHVYCWGANNFGQVGDGSRSDADVATPTEVMGVDEATQVAVGASAACARLADGHVDCWGQNNGGELGDGATSEFAAAPVEVEGLSEALAVSVGNEFACALARGGQVYCWGNGGLGAIGNGVSVFKQALYPAPEKAKVEHATEVSAGFRSVCAVIEGGTVECWGYDFDDQLGDEREGVEIDETPVKTRHVSGVSQVGIGGAGSCVLESGRVECWGHNEGGQLGDGEVNSASEPKWEPVAASGVTSAEELGVGDAFACARLASGGADCWGINYSGEVGDERHGSKAEADTPTPVKGLSGVTQISSGEYHSCAVASGHVYCWGFDETGQLGDGESGAGLYKDTPTEVSALP